MWEAERWILRCRGIPFKATKSELEAWFDTSQLSGPLEESVHITYNDEGRPSGECFMIFGDEDSYYNALRKNKEYMESRYVEIYESDEDDLARALKRGAVNKRAYGGSDAPIVKLRGLPFNTSEEDVKNFFSGLSIVDLTFRENEGRMTGEAYVRFSRQDEATAALEKHMQPMGKRYLEIFKANKKEMQFLEPIDTRKIKKPPSNRLLPTFKGGLNEHKVFMRGIPFQASQGDVIKFFTPLMPKHIEISVGADGRPAGTAYAFFNSHEEAVEAMEKDQSYLESRYVELFLESEPGDTGMAANEAAKKAAAIIAQAHGRSAPSAAPAHPSSDVLGAAQIMAQARGTGPPNTGYNESHQYGGPPQMHGGPPNMPSGLPPMLSGLPPMPSGLPPMPGGLPSFPSGPMPQMVPQSFSDSYSMYGGQQTDYHDPNYNYSAPSVTAAYTPALPQHIPPPPPAEDYSVPNSMYYGPPPPPVASQTAGYDAGYYASQAAGYNATSQAAGYDATSQAAGYNATSQAAGYDATSQAAGYNATSQAAGYDATSQAAGYNATSQAAGYDATSQASGYDATSQVAGYDATPGLTGPVSAPHFTSQAYPGGANRGPTNGAASLAPGNEDTKPAPAAPAAPPVRKSLMAGAVRARDEENEYDVWPKRGKSDTGRGGGRGFGGRGVGGRGFGGRGFGGRGFGGRGFGGRDGPRGRGMRGRGGARGGARGGRGGSGIPAEATRPGYQPKINPHKPRLLPSSFTLKTDYPEEGGADVPSGESSDPNAENQ